MVQDDGTFIVRGKVSLSCEVLTATAFKVDGDWQDAAKKALAKERPPEGWPKPKDEDSDE